MLILIYQNKDNKYKYIEVHNDGQGHNACLQYMYYPNRDVTTYLGDGKLHRCRKQLLDAILKDYRLVDYIISAHTIPKGIGNIQPNVDDNLFI